MVGHDPALTLLVAVQRGGEREVPLSLLTVFSAPPPRRETTAPREGWAVQAPAEAMQPCAQHTW